jgi:hypothetical protein
VSRGATTACSRWCESRPRSWRNRSPITEVDRGTDGPPGASAPGGPERARAQNENGTDLAHDVAIGEVNFFSTRLKDSGQLDKVAGRLRP